jgi:hypothetical protein
VPGLQLLFDRQHEAGDRHGLAGKGADRGRVHGRIVVRWSSMILVVRSSG